MPMYMLDKSYILIYAFYLSVHTIAYLEGTMKRPRESTKTKKIQKSLRNRSVTDSDQETENKEHR